jgi:hypothetical protein
VAYDLFGGGLARVDREFAYVTRQLQVNSQIKNRDHGCVLPKRIAPQPPLVIAYLCLFKPRVVEVHNLGSNLHPGLLGDARLLESDAHYILIST